uniref:(California timema) hypothetical protein n=1 Tax=Timema californicum TaxID=61474 RepID=A0A7R9J6T0_TIMCA|nr:unnamed protein product [Timema californicum]
MLDDLSRYTSVGTFSLFRFLDENAFLYGFVIPTLCLLVMIVLYLARSAVVIRYTVSMQVDKKVRDKMRRKRNLQLCLFVKGYSYHQHSINSKCTRKYWQCEHRAISTARCITNLDVDSVVIYSCNSSEPMNPTDHAVVTAMEARENGELKVYLRACAYELKIHSNPAQKHDQMICFKPGHKVTLLVSSVAAFGALFKLTGINAFWIAFNVGHGLQGIAVALCVTCNCQVLKIYTRSLRRKRHAQYGTHYGGYCAAGVPSELSKSTSLQMLTWDPTPDAV